jgi:hypothetical protein
MKITKSQLRRIIKEEVREAKMYSSPGQDEWRRGEQNAGLDTDLEQQISSVPPKDLMKNYEDGLSHWITREIINNKIDQEEVHYHIEKLRKSHAYTFKLLADEAVERIIDKGITDAFRHDSEVP